MSFNQQQPGIDPNGQPQQFQQPQQQYAPPPQQQYAPPPAQQYQQPPTQQYAPPPQQQYAPPPQQQYQQAPQQQYAPPQQGYQQQGGYGQQQGQYQSNKITNDPSFSGMYKGGGGWVKVSQQSQEKRIEVSINLNPGTYVIPENAVLKVTLFPSDKKDREGNYNPNRPEFNISLWKPYNGGNRGGFPGGNNGFPGG